MAYLRLWVHEQVSKLDHPRFHRHIAVAVAVLFVVTIFGTPAYRLAFGQTEPILVTQAEDSGSGKLVMAAVTATPFQTVTFDVSSDTGFSSSLKAAGGPLTWSSTVSVEPGNYTVKARGIDSEGREIFGTNFLTVTIGGGGSGSEPAVLKMEAFVQEATGSDFVAVKAASDKRFQFVNFTIIGDKGLTLDVDASDSSGTGLTWNTVVRLPFGDTYTVFASGVDASNNSVISGTLELVMPEQGGSGTTEPTEETRVDMKDARLSGSGVPNRVLMEAVTEGPAPVSVRFKVTSVNFSQLFEAVKDASTGTWKAVHDLPFGATYTIFAEAKLENGSLAGSASLRTVIIGPESEATSGTGEPTAEETQTTEPKTEPATEPTTETTTESATELRADIISPRSGDTFSGPVTLVAKVSVPDAAGATFIIRNTATGTQTQLEGAPGATAGNWTAFFEAKPNPFDVRARVKLTDGTLFLSDAVAFKIALPETEPLLTEPTEPIEPILTEPVLTEPTEPKKEPLPEPEEPTETDTPLPPPPPEAEEESVALTEEERIRLEQQKLEAERAERLRLEEEQERLAAQQDPTDTVTTAPEEIRSATSNPLFLTMTPEEKRRLEEERRRKLLEEERARILVPTIARDATEQKTTLERVAFMTDSDTDLEGLSEECLTNGISRNLCAAWLKTRYQAKSCVLTGAITKEACVEHIRKTENREPEAREMIGIATRSELESFRDATRPLYNTSFSTDELDEGTKSVMAAVPPGTRKVRMLEAADTDASGEKVASPGIWTFDTDGDGLPDDLEERFGTDPENEDTDGDGFLDAEEIRNGFNPLGEGRLERRVAGIEKALLDGVAIEEPRISDRIDRSLRIEDANEENADASAPFRLAGSAAPNSVISLFIYTYLPVVVTTTTDADGNWNYDFSSKLAEGSHEAYVSVNDDTGKVIARSEPLAFFVRTAQAVSEEEFLAGDINVPEPAATYTRWFIGGGIAIVLLALGLVIVMVRRTGKEPDLSEPDDA